MGDDGYMDAAAVRGDAHLERTYWVEVNETHIWLYGTTAHDFWLGFRYMAYAGTDRIRIITAGVIGDTVHVACNDREHAQWLREHMLSRGVPKSAATLRAYRIGEEPAALEMSTP